MDGGTIKTWLSRVCLQRPLEEGSNPSEGPSSLNRIMFLQHDPDAIGIICKRLGSGKGNR